MPRSSAQGRFSTGAYGVVGHDIVYSLSPYIFRTVFKALGWRADYAIFDIEKGELPSLLDAMRTAPIRGLNITKPYKQTVISHLDRLDDSARVVGAVNTVVNVRGRLIGYNTDVEGVVAALSRYGARLRGKDALILGAGGGARAVAFALLKHFGVRGITIAARRPVQARQLIHDVQDRMPPARVASAAFRPVADFSEALARATLVVNATPIGSGTKKEERLLPKGVQFHSGAIAFDLVYRPRPTLFCRAAEDLGIRSIIDGWPMLIAQAEVAFRLWTGRGFPPNVRRQLLNTRQLP